MVEYKKNSFVTSRSTERFANKDRLPPVARLQNVTLLSKSGKPIFESLSMHIRRGQGWIVFCHDRQSRSALLGCLSGRLKVDSGRVDIGGHVSWPLGEIGGLSRHLSAFENSKFICQVYGEPEDQTQGLDHIRSLVGFNEKQWYQMPLKSLSAIEKNKVNLAISLAHDFDLYLVDPAIFRHVLRLDEERDAWLNALHRRLRRRAFLMFASEKVDLGLIDRCSRGLVLENGKMAIKGSIDVCNAYLSGEAVV
jgi:ABC-type polysaccharide/polyol phosphate transport system ATPase subunit